MIFSSPVSWVLPIVLLLAWIALWARCRRVPTWFFVTGPLLAVLCFPVGMLVAKAESNGVDCSPDNLCFSMNAVYWWCNGFFGLLATGALGIATLAVTAAIEAMHARK